eukprot:TRINITY_DN4273_c0_g3_i1.p2 TRINITY_DN4273_c0_g3~~TRINITY_DN4273_c0_g3_i1.p2  ORF type:complete len:266 (+),score=83.64 TRINITY_DN4273_c0_g3_i1:79-876(+)
MRGERRRMRSVDTPSRLYHSVQVSSRPSVQTSPKSTVKPKSFLSITKHNIEFLAREVKKYRQEYEDLRSLHDQALDSGEKVKQRIELLKQQLEMVLQQNAKLTAAKKELKEELEELGREREAVEKERNKYKRRRKKEVDVVMARKKSSNGKHKKEMQVLESKLQEEKFSSFAKKQEMSAMAAKLKILKEMKLKAANENFKNKQKIIKEIGTLSDIIEITCSVNFLPTHILNKAHGCLLYTSDAADDMQCVDLGGRRIIKKKKKNK